jgi:hypothetical protein
MTDNIIASLAGAVLALLFGYAPGVRQWYEALEPTRKALVMAGALAHCGAAAVWRGVLYAVGRGRNVRRGGLLAIGSIVHCRTGGKSGDLSHWRKTVAYGDGANGVG